MSFVFGRLKSADLKSHYSDSDLGQSSKLSKKGSKFGIFRRRTTSASSRTGPLDLSEFQEGGRMVRLCKKKQVRAKSDDEVISRSDSIFHGVRRVKSATHDSGGGGSGRPRLQRQDTREVYQKLGIRRQNEITSPRSFTDLSTTSRSEPDLFDAIHAPMNSIFLEKEGNPSSMGCVGRKKERKSILSLGLTNRRHRVSKDKSGSGRKRRHAVVSEPPLHLVEAEALSRKISVDKEKGGTGGPSPISRKPSVFSNISWNDLLTNDGESEWSRSSQSSVSTRYASCSSDDLHTQLQAQLQSLSLDDGNRDDGLTFSCTPETSPQLPAGKQNRVLCTTKEEYSYRQVLKSVVNPLGVPDHRPGYRPLELAYHLKEVFEIESTKHELCVAEAQSSKVADVVLNVQVVEARDLEDSAISTTDPYCVLAITDPKMGKLSPRGTPVNSPGTSPILVRRKGHNLTPELEVRRTQILKDTPHPRWNEEFEMQVNDLNTEELHVFVWDDKLKTEPSKISERVKPSGLIGFFKQITRHSFDGLEGYIGHCKVLLRDIPATGSDSWYELYEDRKQKTRADGQCRLRLQLTTKLDLDCVDSTESDMCSIEEYHFIVTKLYHHVIRSINCHQKEHGADCHPQLDELSGPSSYILQQFATQNHLTKISQTLMELVVILECLSEGMLDCTSSEKLLKTGIVNLEMEWLTLSSGFEQDNQLKNVTDTEMTLFDAASAKFIRHVIIECEAKDNLPKLFPPQYLDKKALNKSLGTPLTLLNLHLWKKESKTESQQSITNLSTNKLQHLSKPLEMCLQADVRNWCDERLSSIQSSVKDSVLPEIKMLVDIIDECIQCLTPLYSVNQEFSRLGIDYYRTVSLALEPKISNRALEMMLYLDQYQLKYHRYPVNIRDSSQVSLQLYMTLKRFATVIQSHLVQRDVFRVSLFRYQDWFSNAVIFWLQTFKEESIRRMEKALLIDKDVVQVTCLLKYSNSSVDVLSVFAKIVSEWMQIEFNDADIALLGVTKITDTICDGVIHYMNKVEIILENNGYYDFIDNQQFDITDQLCITLNNISHVLGYLEELPTLLRWEDVCEHMSLKHENDRVGILALQTLRNLVSTANEEVHVRGHVLLDRITDKIADDLYRYTLTFIQSRPERSSSIDEILEYLDTNLHVLVEKLDPAMFPKFLEHIWKTEVDIFTKLLLPGKPPEYYRQMHSHLGTLRDYIQRGGTRVKTECFPYKHLVDTLKINSLSSTELIYEHNRNLTADLTTPLVHFGHLEVKVGVREFPDNTVAIETKVIRATDLPAVSRKDDCSSFVSVNLFPVPDGCHDNNARTSVIKKTRSPTYKQCITLGEMPGTVLGRSGTIISYSAWHHEAILPDDFLGEVSIPLDGSTPRIGERQTIDDLPALIMPLKRSKEPTCGPYKVLKERVDWDPVAREYLDRRSVVAGHRPTLTVCAPVQFLVSLLKGKKPPSAIRGNNLLQQSADYDDGKDV